MCFVQACNIGLATNKIVPRLPHRIIGGLEIGILSSPSKEHNHVSSATMLVRLLYSDPIEDLEIICCLLENHDTRFKPK